MNKAFTPAVGGTVNVGSTGTSATIALAGSTRDKNVRAYNGGTALAFVEFGNSAIAATTSASMPLGVGVSEILNVGVITHAAVICATAQTALVYFTTGDGGV